METVHEGEKPLKCSHCEEGFVMKHELKKHQFAAHINQQTVHSCTLCDKTFTKRTGLQNHIKTVHEEKRRYGCEVCGKAFRKRDHLKRHYDGVHVGKDYYIDQGLLEF